MEIEQVGAIKNFASSSAGFYRKSAVDQMLAIAWFSEARLGRSHFDSSYMRQGFKDAGLEVPNISIYLSRLINKKPPQLIKERNGYRLSGALRRDLDKRLGGDPTVDAISQMLAELPAKVPDLAERAFLSEALSCYRVKAYRAAIIMVWNLTYDHIIRWILANQIRLQSFNQGIAAKFPKKNLIVMRLEDFAEVKESEFIEICRVSRLLEKNICQILKDKLGRRNMAAHPSRVVITQHQADDMISDLILNVVLYVD